MERDRMGEDMTSKRRIFSKEMRARKDMLEGTRKGQEAGSRLWQAISPILRSLDFLWRATKRIYVRERLGLLFQKIITSAIQKMYQNSSNRVDDILII